MIAEDVSLKFLKFDTLQNKIIFIFQNNIEIFNERHNHSCVYINPPENDQIFFWKNQNDKLKNIMAQFYVNFHFIT